MPTRRKPLDSVLVKPAGPDCNLACRYCFYRDRARLFTHAQPHRMSEAVLEATIRQTLRAGAPQVAFGWQGGEPTLMGIPFFERAIEYEKHYGRAQTIGNGLQTNGMLIDAAWARFLAANQFLVGLSLDGPRELHDRYRVSGNSRPTWPVVMDAAKRLLDAGVAVNALSVVNDCTAEHARAVYEFLRDTGLTYMQFVPCLEHEPVRGRNAALPTSFSVTPEKLGRFLCELFDAWRADFRDGEPTTRVRWFEAVFATYIGVPPPECSLQAECGGYVVVEHNGEVFACDFYVAPEWRLGNVGTDDLAALLNSPRQARFGRRKAGLPAACRACRWLPHCRGGCPREGWEGGGTGATSYFCEAYRVFFEHADPFFRALAGDDFTTKDTKGEERGS